MSGQECAGEWVRRSALALYALPPGTAGLYSEAQRAVLAVIGIQSRTSAGCIQSVSDLARAADTSTHIVMVALKKARNDGLLQAIPRYREDGSSDMNLYRIQDAEWREWLGLPGSIG